jgi:hypothetical protein
MQAGVAVGQGEGLGRAETMAHDPKQIEQDAHAYAEAWCSRDLAREVGSAGLVVDGLAGWIPRGGVIGIWAKLMVSVTRSAVLELGQPQRSRSPVERAALASCPSRESTLAHAG